MRVKTRWILALATFWAVGATARADVWDVQTQNDNTPASENELVHGSDQLHDLGALPGPAPAADLDYYRLSQSPFASYEIVADATSGDIGTTLGLDRVASDGTTLVQASSSVGLGFSRSLRWVNTAVTPEDTQLVRVASGSCTTSCGADDVYRIRAYETTYAVPRFNNSGSQITVFLLQNPTNYRISGTVYFWSPAGAPVGSSPFTLGAKELLALNTASVAPGMGGTLTIAHDGRYGDLAGKAVALEPATGFSFDNPMLPRPH